MEFMANVKDYHLPLQPDIINKIQTICEFMKETRSELFTRLIDAEFKNLGVGSLSIDTKLKLLDSKIDRLTNSSFKANRVSEITIMAILNYHISELKQKHPNENLGIIINQIIKLIGEYMNQSPEEKSQINLQSKDNPLMKILENMVK